MSVARDLNVIVVSDKLLEWDASQLLVPIHKLIHVQGFEDIVLDFADCEAAFPIPLISLCVQVLRWRQSGIDFKLTLPEKPELARLFLNSNWASLLDTRYPEAMHEDFRNLSTARFTSSQEQSVLVDRAVRLVMGALPGIQRGDLAALEWAINEVTDNALRHSESEVGGLLQVVTFPASRRIQLVVADAGIGIPKSLQAATRAQSDGDILREAIKEGVTSGDGLGNGLYGSYEICVGSGGAFHLESGYGRLAHLARRPLDARSGPVPFHGTIIAGTLDLGQPGLLQAALRIKGREYRPTDFIEMNYEETSSNTMLVKLSAEAPSFGSRPAGTPVRNRLLNLIRMEPGQKITIDFAGVPLLSSSFADEVFGKLFVEIGPLAFTNRLQLINVSSDSASLIDRAIIQRTAAAKR